MATCLSACFPSRLPPWPLRPLPAPPLAPRAGTAERPGAGGLPAAGEVLRLGGLRYIVPYDHEIRLKLGRFAGQSIAKALGQTEAETGATRAYWAAELRCGRVAMERGGAGRGLTLEVVGPDYVVRPDDRARLRLHIHERVVPDVAPTIVYADEDFVAASKPSGVEIFSNPLGGAVRSSLLGMLEDMGYPGLLPAHRIDKPVSGVVCTARHRKAASRLSRCVTGRQFRKTYLARVLAPEGSPQEGLTVDAPLAIHHPTATASVDPSGDPSVTVVRRVLRRFGDGTAVVEVEPLSGRMHQIRCHLEHAGFPIFNDGKYGGRAVPGRPAFQDSPARELAAMLREHQRDGCEACAFYLRVAGGATPAPAVEEGIWLHSWRYEFPTLGLVFETELPSWARCPPSTCQPEAPAVDGLEGGAECGGGLQDATAEPEG